MYGFKSFSRQSRCCSWFQLHELCKEDEHIHYWEEKHTASKSVNGAARVVEAEKNLFSIKECLHLQATHAK